MKQLFLILSLFIVAGRLQAQNISKNEPIVKEISINAAVLVDVVEYPSYRVICQQNKKNFSFEVLSPKYGKAEVKLVTTLGMDICTIHKGVIREGKNVFMLSHQKLARGAYYVVSKLESGEQFADRIVIDK
jgi:hypothetical protein